MSGRWFRFYDDVINDPKVLCLPESLRWQWVAILCVTSKNGGELPGIEDITIMLRTSKHKAAAILTSLHSAELLDKTETGFRPHNWEGRQYKSDVSTTRVKRFRKQQRNVSETPPETEEQNTETEKKEKKVEAVATATRPTRKGSRLPDNFQLSEADIEFAAKHNFAGDPLQAVFSDFCDYWHARAGPLGVKLDWPATWRRWIRTEAKKHQNQKGKPNGTDHENSLKRTLERLRDAGSDGGSEAPSPAPPRLLSHG